MYAVNSYTEARTALQALATINQVKIRKSPDFSVEALVFAYTILRLGQAIVLP